MNQKKTVVFVCIENACRSQMAEAFAKMLGKDVIEAYSSGSRAKGEINKKAIAAMEAVGYDLTTHTSKALEDIPQIEYDWAVTMGCGETCPAIRAKQREDWDIPDPKEMDKIHFNLIRDIIRYRVTQLIKVVRSEE